tara:strand:+ start:18394 stop:18594 length:201 start_codon:yes stop_codon:yes gene_type:complete
MIQALLLKTIIKAVMRAIAKADDKEIASGHEKRIKKLEKVAHPPQEYICCGKCGCKISKTKKEQKK